MDTSPVQQIQERLQKLFDDPGQTNALWKCPPLQALHKIEWHQPFKKLAPPVQAAHKTTPNQLSQSASDALEPVTTHSTSIKMADSA